MQVPPQPFPPLSVPPLVELERVAHEPEPQLVEVHPELEKGLRVH